MVKKRAKATPHPSDGSPFPNAFIHCPQTVLPPSPFSTFLSLFFLLLRFRLGITSNSRRSKVPSVTSTVSSSPAGLSSSSSPSSSGAEGGDKTGAEAPHSTNHLGLSAKHTLPFSSSAQGHTLQIPTLVPGPVTGLQIWSHDKTLDPSACCKSHLPPWLNSPFVSSCGGSISAFCRLFCQPFRGGPTMSSSGVSFPGQQGHSCHSLSTGSTPCLQGLRAGELAP